MAISLYRIVIISVSGVEWFIGKSLSSSITSYSSTSISHNHNTNPPAPLHTPTLCIQSFVFGITPLLFYLIYLALRDVVQTDLIEGYCMLGCLPMTINMCYVLTSSGKGNASAALFNATLGNIIGVRAS